MSHAFRAKRLPSVLFSFTLAATSFGCKASLPGDAALTQAVSAQISGDSSLSGQPIQATVQAGVATISGSVLNDAQRTIVARDAAAVQGIREVINNVTLASAQSSASAAAPLPLTRPEPTSGLIPSTPRIASSAPRTSIRQPAPIQREQPQPQPAQQAYNPPPPPPAIPRTPPPAFRNVSIPAGTSIPVRVTQTLDSATTQQGDNFSGIVASDIVIDGLVAIPAGSAVTGNVDAVQEAAHFKGNSLLTVSLTGIKTRGERLPLSTDPYTVSGKGRGKNTAEKAGGGAAVGAILGGILGGGKGAAIGAGVGGAGGAGVNAVTRGQQVQIPSESIVRFQTASAIGLRVKADAVSQGDASGQGLQSRSNP